MTQTHPLYSFFDMYQVFPDFIAHLEKLAGAIQPLLDAPPVNIPELTSGSLRKRLSAAKTLMPLAKCGGLVDACLCKSLLHL